MFKQIAEILEKVSLSAEKDDSILFSDGRYSGISLKIENFHPPEVASGTNKKMCFVDGGNSELLSSAGFSLQIIRGYFSIFQKNKKLSFGIRNFYLLVTAEAGALSYKCRFFSKSGDELSETGVCDIFGVPEEEAAEFISKMGSFLFEPMDKSILQGDERARPSKVADVIRRYLELSLARIAAPSLSKGDIIVLDGTLQCTFTGERYFMDALYSCASEKGIIVSALAKTCSLITQKGRSVIGVLLGLAPFSEWYYHPVAEIRNPDHFAEIFFIKLSSDSLYAFRFELHKNSALEIDSVIDALQKNSRDYSFPGYPYGLIDADKFAQVTNEEKSSLRAMFFSESGRLSLRLSEFEAGLNAHGILNRF